MQKKQVKPRKEKNATENCRVTQGSKLNKKRWENIIEETREGETWRSRGETRCQIFRLGIWM
jgi:hypothetical protein